MFRVLFLGLLCRVDIWAVIKLSIFFTHSIADPRHLANFSLKLKLSNETLQKAFGFN